MLPNQSGLKFQRIGSQFETDKSLSQNKSGAHMKRSVDFGPDHLRGFSLGFLSGLTQFDLVRQPSAAEVCISITTGLPA